MNFECTTAKITSSNADIIKKSLKEFIKFHKCMEYVNFQNGNHFYAKIFTLTIDDLEAKADLIEDYIIDEYDFPNIEIDKKIINIDSGQYVYMTIQWDANYPINERQYKKVKENLKNFGSKIKCNCGGFSRYSNSSFVITVFPLGYNVYE